MTWTSIPHPMRNDAFKDDGANKWADDGGNNWVRLEDWAVLAKPSPGAWSQISKPALGGPTILGAYTTVGTRGASTTVGRRGALTQRGDNWTVIPTPVIP